MKNAPAHAADRPGGHDENRDHGHDAWHQHTAAEGVPQHEHGSQTNAKALGLVFLVMVFGTVAVIAVLIVYFNTTSDRFRSRLQEGSALMAPTWNAKVAARERLEGFGWVDQEAGTAHTPVSAAMDRVIEDYRNRSSQAPASDAPAEQTATASKES